MKGSWLRYFRDYHTVPVKVMLFLCSYVLSRATIDDFTFGASEFLFLYITVVLLPTV